MDRNISRVSSIKLPLQIRYWLALTSSFFDRFFKSLEPGSLDRERSFQARSILIDVISSEISQEISPPIRDLLWDISCQARSLNTCIVSSEISHEICHIKRGLLVRDVSLNYNRIGALAPHNLRKCAKCIILRTCCRDPVNYSIDCEAPSLRAWWSLPGKYSQ